MSEPRVERSGTLGTEAVVTEALYMGDTQLVEPAQAVQHRFGFALAGLIVSAVASGQGCRLGLTPVALSGADGKRTPYLTSNPKSATC